MTVPMHKTGYVNIRLSVNINQNKLIRTNLFNMVRSVRHSKIAHVMNVSLELYNIDVDTVRCILLQTLCKKHQPQSEISEITLS